MGIWKEMCHDKKKIKDRAVPLPYVHEHTHTYAHSRAATQGQRTSKRPMVTPASDGGGEDEVRKPP